MILMSRRVRGLFGLCLATVSVAVTVVAIAFTAKVSGTDSTPMKVEDNGLQALAAKSLLSAYISGVWHDQFGNVRSFEPDGVYSVVYADGSCLKGTYTLVENSEAGTVSLRTDNRAEGTVDFSIDIIDANTDPATAVDVKYDDYNDYRLVLWTDSRINNLILER